MSLKVAEASRQAALERTRLMDEIRDLKDELEQSRLASQPNGDISDTKVGDHEFIVFILSFPLQDTRWRTMSEHEQAEVQSLRMALEDRSVELDGLRKRLNRELAVNGPPDASKLPSKHESEEIMGLKYDSRNELSHELSQEPTGTLFRKRRKRH